MTSIYICISHNNNFMISHFRISNLPSILFWFLSSDGLPTPAPIAVINAPISLLVKTCLSLALSTFNIFPLKGSIA